MRLPAAATGLQLRLPGGTSCIDFDGRELTKQNCRVTFLQQRWEFESSSMRFRHNINSSLCLDFQEDFYEFRALDCSREADARQKFHFSIGTDGRKYCIGRDERKCVQEATLGMCSRLPSRLIVPRGRRAFPLIGARCRDPAARATNRRMPAVRWTTPSAAARIL